MLCITETGDTQWDGDSMFETAWQSLVWKGASKPEYKANYTHAYIPNSWIACT